MKLLFVNGHLQVGGVEKSLVDLLNSIDYSKHQVDLLLFEGLGEYIGQIPKNVNVILCDLTPTYGPFLSSTRKLLKNRKFSLIYWKFALTLCSRFGPQWMKMLRLLSITKSYDCAIAYRVGICAEYVGFVAKAKKKYMWWHHGEFNYDNKTIKSWQKTATKLDEIVCVSQGTKKMITPYFRNYIKNITVIPNMLLTEEIQKKSILFHPYESYFMENDKIIISVGRMSPEKKMENVVYAAENLINRGYNSFKWFIVGDGSEFSKIKNLIFEKNLEDKIICVGRKSNPYPYIADADLFVHTSYVESQGLAVLEAMAIGIPCVITKSLGVMEFVEDGKNAILAEQSVDSLVGKIIDILNFKIETNDMIKYQKRTIEKYSSKSVMKKVMKLFGE